jgi:peptidoglycan-associated lipoprotein
MKTNLTIIVLTLLMLSACSSTLKETSTPEVATTQTTTQDTTSNNAQTGTAAKIIPSVLTAQLQDMQKNSVYFERDEFVIKPEYNSIIQQHAEFAKAHGVTITLEGNADERGSSEYNLALGNKRANAVRKSLEIMGVPANRIKSVSFGEEKPRLTCHEEKCWGENRRVDFNGRLES